MINPGWFGGPLVSGKTMVRTEDFAPSVEVLSLHREWMKHKSSLVMVGNLTPWAAKKTSNMNFRCSWCFFIAGTASNGGCWNCLIWWVFPRYGNFNRKKLDWPLVHQIFIQSHVPRSKRGFLYPSIRGWVTSPHARCVDHGSYGDCMAPHFRPWTGNLSRSKAFHVCHVLKHSMFKALQFHPQLCVWWRMRSTIKLPATIRVGVLWLPLFI